MYVYKSLRLFLHPPPLRAHDIPTPFLLLSPLLFDSNPRFSSSSPKLSSSPATMSSESDTTSGSMERRNSQASQDENFHNLFGGRSRWSGEMGVVDSSSSVSREDSEAHFGRHFQPRLPVHRVSPHFPALHRPPDQIGIFFLCFLLVGCNT